MNSFGGVRQHRRQASNQAATRTLSMSKGIHPALGWRLRLALRLAISTRKDRHRSAAHLHASPRWTRRLCARLIPITSTAPSCRPTSARARDAGLRELQRRLVQAEWALAAADRPSS
ncbi:MAG: hypothetical protein M5R42_18680 [Rhodocyclaceae bacterium]|nr:hypothetical protein [Rhodocyclaceae bacterium]